jgi:hypothetical protein
MKCKFFSKLAASIKLKRRLLFIDESVFSMSPKWKLIWSPLANFWVPQTDYSGKALCMIAVYCASDGLLNWQLK